MNKFKKPTLKTVSGAIVAIQILSAIIILQIAIVFIIHYSRSEVEYYSVSVDGVKNKIPGLPRPHVSTKALLRWATLAAISSYTINFAEYEQNLLDLKKYFTDAGYASYFKSVEASGFLEDIIKEKLIVTAVGYGPSIVVSEGDNYGRYAWSIQVPLLLTYQGAGKETREANKLVSLLVTTVSPKESSRGIGVKQLTEATMSRGKGG
jgi:intracellular multiplication protein IcmL